MSVEQKKLIIIDGDQVNFNFLFGTAIIVPIPGKITGSGSSTLQGKKVCIEGDEKSVEVQNVRYIAPPYIVPGEGIVKVIELASDQVATKTSDSNTKVILKGAKFKAKLEITRKASDLFGGQDPNKEYTGGEGFFINANQKFTGT